MRRALIAFPLSGWVLFAALAFSFTHDPHDACDSEALWTSAWFFLPPVLAVPGLATARPFQAGSLLAAIGLLAGWGLFALVWFVSAISCGGG